MFSGSPLYCIEGSGTNYRFLQEFYEKPCTNPEHNVCITYHDGNKTDLKS